MDEWPVVDSRVEYENPYFAVRRERVEQADGTTGDFYHLDMPDDVAVLALTDESSLVLVEQYRPRLSEETGYRAGDVEHLGSCFLTAWQRNRLHVVVARDLESGDSEPHSGESDITAHHRSVEETFEYVRSTPPVAWLAVPLLLAREHGVL